MKKPSQTFLLTALILAIAVGASAFALPKFPGLRHTTRDTEKVTTDGVIRNGSTAYVQWTGVDAGSPYRVRMTNVSSSVTEQDFTTSSTAITVSGLKTGVAYRFLVTTANDGIIIEEISM